MAVGHHGPRSQSIVVRTVAAGVAASCAWVAACGGGGSPAAPSVTIRDILVSQSRVVLARAGTTRLFARVQRTDGTGDDITGSAAWSSSDASVVAVQSGVLTATGIGGATVTAAYEGRAGTVDVVVRRNTILVGSLTLSAPKGWLPEDWDHGLGAQFLADGIPVKGRFTFLKQQVWGAGFGTPASWLSIIVVDPGQHGLTLEIVSGTGDFSTGDDGYVEIRDRETGELLERKALAALRVKVTQAPDRGLTWLIDVGTYSQ